MVQQNSQPAGKRPLNLVAAFLWLCLCGVPAAANPSGPVIACGTMRLDSGLSGGVLAHGSPIVTLNRIAGQLSDATIISNRHSAPPLLTL